jgi:hypothetical protein
VLSRWDTELRASQENTTAPELFLRSLFRRVRQMLAELHDNDDAALISVADWTLRHVG